MEVLNEKSAKSFRQYFLEYAVIALTISVIYLFKMYSDQNRFFQQTILTNNSRMEIVIQANTDAMLLFKATHQ